ncbi:UDP-N-acetylmuramate dehydrogenase [Candidatus Saccharibacteria bacterium]|nr:UDP-N-acetylmuramate dehydrogenase [Candidatus Saccharibacteria bacterium]
MKIRENVSIASLTTMRIGGVARYVIEITDARDVRKAYAFAYEKDLPVWVMGGGANTIGLDDGFPGVIILNKLRGIEIQSEVAGSLILKGMGGENWDNFVAFACRRGYSGMEMLSGIPGTLGAAPVQNIGAYGQEISQVLLEVFVYDSLKDRAMRMPARALGLGYRRSIFNTGKGVGRYFIISVTVRLRREQVEPPFYASLQGYIDEHHETDFSPENIRRMVLAIRGSKLPDPAVEASAGSFFKNVVLTPEEAKVASAKGYPVHQKSDGRIVLNSGWLIEKAGLSGKVFNGFKVSERAALVLINESGRSYEDLKAAREAIREKVKEKYGFELLQEPVELRAEKHDGVGRRGDGE